MRRNNLRNVIVRNFMGGGYDDHQTYGGCSSSGSSSSSKGSGK